MAGLSEPDLPSDDAETSVDEHDDTEPDDDAEDECVHAGVKFPSKNAAHRERLHAGAIIGFGIVGASKLFCGTGPWWTVEEVAALQRVKCSTQTVTEAAALYASDGWLKGQAGEAKAGGIGRGITFEGVRRDPSVGWDGKVANPEYPEANSVPSAATVERVKAKLAAERAAEAAWLDANHKFKGSGEFGGEWNVEVAAPQQHPKPSNLSAAAQAAALARKERERVAAPYQQRAAYSANFLRDAGAEDFALELEALTQVRNRSLRARPYTTEDFTEMELDDYSRHCSDDAETIARVAARGFRRKVVGGVLALGIDEIKTSGKLKSDGGVSIHREGDKGFNRTEKVQEPQPRTKPDQRWYERRTQVGNYPEPVGSSWQKWARFKAPGLPDQTLRWVAEHEGSRAEAARFMHDHMVRLLKKSNGYGKKSRRALGLILGRQEGSAALVSRHLLRPSSLSLGSRTVFQSTRAPSK